MARVTLAQSAQTDLLEAWLFIAEDNQQAADRVLDTIDKETHTLLLQPLMGRARPELADRVRSWPTSTPYILFYLADDEGITVLRSCIMPGMCGKLPFDIQRCDVEIVDYH